MKSADKERFHLIGTNCGKCMSKKALKIISCDDSRKWYQNLIGEYVPFLAAEEREYKSREPAGYINFVSISDAVIVDVEEDVWWDLAKKWGYS